MDQIFNVIILVSLDWKLDNDNAVAVPRARRGAVSPEYAEIQSTVTNILGAEPLNLDRGSGFNECMTFLLHWFFLKSQFSIWYKSLDYSKVLGVAVLGVI